MRNYSLQHRLINGNTLYLINNCLRYLRYLVLKPSVIEMQKILPPRKQRTDPAHPINSAAPNSNLDKR